MSGPQLYLFDSANRSTVRSVAGCSSSEVGEFSSAISDDDECEGGGAHFGEGQDVFSPSISSTACVGAWESKLYETQCIHYVMCIFRVAR